jgi:Golgi CORVET complex core vacuolar protein 8/WD domain, G-beta repeat
MDSNHVAEVDRILAEQSDSDSDDDPSRVRVPATRVSASSTSGLNNTGSTHSHPISIDDILNEESDDDDDADLAMLIDNLRQRAPSASVHTVTPNTTTVVGGSGTGAATMSSTSNTPTAISTAADTNTISSSTIGSTIGVSLSDSPSPTTGAAPASSPTTAAGLTIDDILREDDEDDDVDADLDPFLATLTQTTPSTTAISQQQPKPQSQSQSQSQPQPQTQPQPQPKPHAQTHRMQNDAGPTNAQPTTTANARPTPQRRLSAKEQYLESSPLLATAAATSAASSGGAIRGRKRQGADVDIRARPAVGATTQQQHGSGESASTNYASASTSTSAAAAYASVVGVDASHLDEVDRILQADAEDDDAEYVDEMGANVDTILASENDDISMQLQDTRTRRGSDIDLELKSIADKFQRAAALEEQYSRIGNYNIVAPLQVKRDNKKKHTQAADNLIRLDVLSKLTQVLARDRSKCGLPKSAAIHFKGIAVGTTRGLIHVFDHFQNLMAALGSLYEAKERGAVTCVDFSPDGGFLAAGHEHGMIVVWDIMSRKCIKAITGSDAFPNPVSHIIYRAQEKGTHEVIAADVSGRVNIYKVSSFFMVTNVDTQCLLDGSKGPVLAISSLTANPKSPHPADSLGLLAIADEKRTLIVRLNPQPTVLFQIYRDDKARVGAVPSIAWRPVESRDVEVAARDPREAEITTHPVLVVARDTVVRLLQLSPDSQPANSSAESKAHQNARFKRSHKDNPLYLHQVGLAQLRQAPIIGAQWLGGQVIVLITARNELRVIDPFDMKQLEQRSIASAGLCYDEYAVSTAIKRKEMFYHNSIRCNAHSMLLLGMDEVLEGKVLSWSDRVKALVQQNFWMDGLALALDFYEGKAKAAVGLPRGDAALKAILKDRLVSLLENYIATGLKPLIQQVQRSGTSEGLTSLLQRYAGIAVDYCVTIERTDVLFQQIFSMFLEAHGGDVFLEILEPYILNDKLKYLSPQVMKAFVDLYKRSGKLREVEQCVLHMDIGCLDFMQIVTVCREHCLFSALIYVYNRGCDDYRTPFEQIMHVVLNRSTQLSDTKREAYGYKLLLYVNYCLTGKAFPSGDIEPSRAASVQAEMIGFLFTRSPTIMTDLGDVTPVLQHKGTGNADEDASYPWLRYLLSLHTREVFRLLSVVFESTDWLIHVTARAGPISSSDADTGITGSADSGPVTTAESDNASGSSSAHAPADHAAEENKQAKSGFAGALSNLSFWSKPSDSNEADASAASRPRSRVRATAVAEPSLDEVQKAAASASKSNTGTRADSKSAKLRGRVTPVEVPDRQRILDILVGLMVDTSRDPYDIREADSGDSKASPWSLNQLLELFKFAGRQIASGVVRGSPDLLNRTYAYLCMAPTASTLSSSAATRGMADPSQVVDAQTDRDEREATLMSLLEQVSQDSYNYEALVRLSEKAGFTHVCVLLYKLRSNHAKVIESYLDGDDPNFMQEVFFYISDMMRDSSGNISSDAKTVHTIKNAVLSRIPKLVQVDSDRTARLVIDCFPGDNTRVVNALERHPELQFHYLKSILFAGGSATSSNGTSSHGSNGGATSGSNDADASSSVLLGTAVHERFITLLCKFSPADVYAHLNTHHDYDIDRILALCQKYEINDAAAYLLERTGNVHGAMQLVLETVDARLRVLRSYITAHRKEVEAEVKTDSDEHGVTSATLHLHARRQSMVRASSSCSLLTLQHTPFRRAKDIVTVSTDLCERSNESKKLWFSVLDKFVQLQKALKDDLRQDRIDSVVGNVMHQALYDFLRIVLDRMMNHVSLQAIMRKITTDYQADEFVEFRDTIQGMLGTYSYERNMLYTANKLLSGDMYRTVADLHRLRAHAFAVRQDVCGICSRVLAEESLGSDVKLFNCGHAFHESTCLSRSFHQCPLCNTSKAARRSKRTGDGASHGRNNTSDTQSDAPANTPTDTTSRPTTALGVDRRAREYAFRLESARRQAAAMDDARLAALGTHGAAGFASADTLLSLKPRRRGIMRR